MMRSWLLYIIECVDGSLYTGITTDLRKRINAHNDGSASRYTRAKRPVKLLYIENIATESEARKREAEVKKLSHIDKLKLVQ